MAQKPVRGEDKILFIDNNSGFTTPLSVAGITEISRQDSPTKLDTTDAGHGKRTGNLPGRLTYTLQVTIILKYDDSTYAPDPSQLELLTAKVNRTGAYFRYRANGTAVGKAQDEFFGNIYDDTRANPNDDKQTMTLLIQADGDVNEAVQA